MPKIYLSPSVQEGNMYVTGGNEENYMNLVADALVPYLNSNGIRYVRNSPDMTVPQIIRESNNGDYNLHLSIHSNAAPESEAGMRQGTEAYYFPHSYPGKKMAEIFRDNFKLIHPNPEFASIQPTTSLGEVDRTKAPAVLLEVAYHDNVEDANWIISNIDLIARAIALSLTEYFGLSFIEPFEPKRAIVDTRSGNLNIRNRPNSGAAIIGTVPKGSTVAVYGMSPTGWYTIDYNGVVGFVNGRFISLLEREKQAQQ